MCSSDRRKAHSILVRDFRRADTIQNNIKMNLTHIRKENVIRFIIGSVERLPMPVAVRSKACVCGRSLAGIAGSNTTGCMDVRRE